MDARSARPSRPQSVKELVAQAESFSFNTNIPFRHWTRAAETLYQEASFALSDGDFARAYVMLYRHSVLVLESIPTHPNFKDVESRKAFKPLAKRIDRVLQNLEQLKPEIERVYDEWERMTPPAKRPDETGPPSYDTFAGRDSSLTGKVLDASENQELAVDLAQKELARRDTRRRATRQAGLSEEETQLRRRGGRWDQFDQDGKDELQRQMERARWHLDAAKQPEEEQRIQTVHYQYPSISRSAPITPQPPRPPKVTTDAPHVPQKVPLQPLVPTRPQAPTVPPKVEAPPPVPEKERVTFKPGAYLENGDPIRSIFLPRSLRQQFLDLAADNTRAGLEMCGILCGTPIKNALFIRCLLIPDQKCTSDTCETQNESDVFDYCIGEDLLVLGWIHTHPTQTCFMSSRDLHTHSGYQVMMPESIAIVCAPKFTPSYGIFRLTHPPGLDHILNCNRSETFHPHSVDNLYTETEQPRGHVYESDKLPFYVHDLRSK